MILREVDIKNFRSIKEISVEFDHKCVILVGKNESGKSNVLRALALLDPKRQVSVNDLRDFGFDEPDNQEAYVDFIFSLNEEECIENYIQVAEEKIFLPKSNQYVIASNSTNLTLSDFYKLYNKGIYRVKISPHTRTFLTYRLSDNYKLLLGLRKPIAKPTKAQVELVTGNIVTLVTGLLVHEDLIIDEDKINFTEATLNDFWMTIKNPIEACIKKNLPVCIFWEYNDSNMLPGRITKSDFILNPDFCLPLKYLFQLAGFNDPTLAIQKYEPKLNGYHNLLEKVSQIATKHLTETWKEYKDISIEIYADGEEICATIRDKFHKFDLERRSDGFKRFLTFLIAISAQEKSKNLTNALYLQDEPDSGLHPSGSRYLRDELIRISDSNNVVFSTHSIHMIDKNKTDRHLIVVKENEVTQVKKLDSSNVTDEEVIYNALGASIFDELAKENIIFEGWKDKKLFQESLKTLEKSKQKTVRRLKSLGLCHARGVKDVERVASLLQLLNRDWIVLSDSDAPAKQKQKEYKDERFDGAWLRYDEICGTDFITSEDFIDHSHILKSIEVISVDYPSLSGAEKIHFKSGKSAIELLDTWIKQCGYSKETTKEILSKVKDEIFDSLTLDKILPDYFSFLEKLVEKLPHLA